MGLTEDSFTIFSFTLKIKSIYRPLKILLVGTHYINPQKMMRLGKSLENGVKPSYAKPGEEVVEF